MSVIIIELDLETHKTEKHVASCNDQKVALKQYILDSYDEEEWNYIVDHSLITQNGAVLVVDCEDRLILAV